MMQEFVQQTANIIQENIRNIHTAVPGKILRFDAEKCLADVLPVMKYKKPDGSRIDYPKITGVPVVFLQTMAQKATVAFPVKPGDGCLVIAAEQAIDYWMYGQETDTDLAFDLTSAVCIPGLFQKPNPIVKEACGSNAVIIDVSGTRITVKKGSIKFDSPKIIINGDIEVNGSAASSGGSDSSNKDNIGDIAAPET